MQEFSDGIWVYFANPNSLNLGPWMQLGLRDHYQCPVVTNARAAVGVLEKDRHKFLHLR